MIEEDGKEREVDMGQPGKWRDPWQGSEKVQCQRECLSVSICIPTVLGSSLVSVCGPYLTLCLCLWSDRTS